MNLGSLKYNLTNSIDIVQVFRHFVLREDMAKSYIRLGLFFGLILVISNVFTLLVARQTDYGFLTVVGVILALLSLGGALYFYIRKSAKEARTANEEIQKQIAELKSLIEAHKAANSFNDSPWAKKHDFKSYVFLKKMQEDLDSALKKFLSEKRKKKLLEAESIPSPFYQVLVSVLEYQKAIDHAISLLDEGAKDGKYFKHVPEKELWNNRNKAYDYLI